MSDDNDDEIIVKDSNGTRLADGDSVALSGSLTPRAYLKDNEPRPSLDLLVHRVSTAYHVQRKRQAAQPQEPSEADAPF